MLINNLAAHLTAHRAEIQTAIRRVLNRSWLVLGPEVAAFERSFAAYVGTAHCHTVANGTDALELALRAIGVKPGDQVATVANAGMYATTAILAVSATPVYMDVELESHVVCCSEVERAISQGAQVVVVTHLYGRAVPEMKQITALCRRAEVMLVEDCAQAHGARLEEQSVGSFGDAGCFSFYPTKNLGALGDGGAVVCNDADLAAKVAALRQYGWSTKYRVEVAGARNSRLDELQAAVLSDLLPHLDAWNRRRREIVARYFELISHPEVLVPAAGDEDNVAHLCVVRSSCRDAILEHLRERDIACDVHYPIPDYRQPVFGNRFADTYLPNTERLAREILTLPCYPEMTDVEVRQAAAAVNSFAVGGLQQRNAVPIQHLRKSA